MMMNMIIMTIMAMMMTMTKMSRSMTRTNIAMCSRIAALARRTGGPIDAERRSGGPSNRFSVFVKAFSVFPKPYSVIPQK